MDNQEFDYSGLYHTNNASGAEPQPQQAPQPAQPQQAHPAQQAPAQPAQPQPVQQAQPGGYPNVGSTGMNTANTAQTDFTAPGGPQQGQTPYGYAQPQGGYAGQQGQAGPSYTGRAQDNNGYTASYGYGGGNGGGYNGYSYTSAPQQPPKKPRKKGGAKKVWLRIGAAACAVALGFGGGLLGVVVASRTGLIGGSSVVVQTVERSASTEATNQGSAAGAALSVQDVAAMVSPSVVVITTEQMVSSNTWFGGSYVQSGAGSGVIMSEDGYILTCAHVVSGASAIKVQLADDEETTYDATVIGADTTADVAVIKIEATGLTPAVMGDSDAVAVGEEVVAVGNPLGTLGGTITNGIISAASREVSIEGTDMTLIQTNASISPGNSGGGLFNANGELIGLVNAKSGATNAEGLGFAIPINSALEVAQQLIDNGYVSRPVLGITVVTISDSSTAMQYGVSSLGVYISTVSTGSGAEAAGLKAGDRIVSVDENVVSAATDVTNYIQSKEIGDTVTVQVEREGKLLSLDVTLGESTSQQ